MGLANIMASSSIYRILNIAATFVLTILMSRLMDTGGYGLFTLIIVNITVYNLVSGLGCEAGITYHGAVRTLNTGKLVSIILIILLFQLSLYFIIDFSYHTFYHRRLFNMHYSWPVVLMFLNIAVTDKYNALFYSNHQYVLYNKVIFFLSMIFIAVFGWLFFFYPHFDTEIYLQVYAFIGVIQVVTLIWIYHKTTHQKFAFTFPLNREWKLFFTYSLITVVTNFIQFLAYRIDYWMISYYFSGNKQLGIYSVAVKLVQLFWLLPVLFGGILFPGTAGQQREFNIPKMLSLIRVMNTLNVIAAVASFFIISWAIPVFFGREYADGISPFRWLLPGILLFCNTTVLAAYFAGINRIRINLRGSIFCFLVILIFDFLLIPKYGINGAALASSVGYGLTGIYYVYRFIKIVKVNLKDLFIITPGDKTTVIAFFKSNIIVR